MTISRIWNLRRGDYEGDRTSPHVHELALGPDGAIRLITTERVKVA